MILDPLTQLEDAIISWLSTNSILAQYNWQRWESDVDVAQPRGYVNVAATSDMDLAIQGPMLLEATVVLESVAKSGSQAETVAILLGMLSGLEVVGRLNAQVQDGSLVIVGPAEKPRIEQTIERELRVRRFTVTYPAVWNVVYV